MTEMEKFITSNLTEEEMNSFLTKYFDDVKNQSEKHINTLSKNKDLLDEAYKLLKEAKGSGGEIFLKLFILKMLELTKGDSN